MSPRSNCSAFAEEPLWLCTTDSEVDVENAGGAVHLAVAASAVEGLERLVTERDLARIQSQELAEKVRTLSRRVQRFRDQARDADRSRRQTARPAETPPRSS